MRTIKFRGRDEKGEWHYGNLIADSCVDGTDAAFISPGFPVVLTAMIYRVDPESVGQFTCLHDVEGNEIYEGDRVFFNDPLNDERSEATVYWNETFLRFMLCTGVGDYDLTDSDELQLKVNHAPQRLHLQPISTNIILTNQQAL